MKWIVIVGVFFSTVMSWATPLKVLLLTGQCNHNWPGTTKVLVEMLEGSGKFEVDITKTPQTMTAEQMAKYDLLLSNWNAFGKWAKVKTWSEPTKTAFVEYIKNGGGLMVFHAGGSSFPEWKEYHQIVGATWKLGQTGHDRGIETTIKPIKDHPITKGMKPYKSSEELWFRMEVNAELDVLATAFCKSSQRDEPVAFTTTYGKGRCFNLVLGHLVEDMTDHPEFRTFLVRGSEWAATGAVTD